MQKNMWWRHNFFDDVINTFRFNAKMGRRVDFDILLRFSWYISEYIVHIDILYLNFIFADISKNLKFEFLAVEKICGRQILHTGSMIHPLYVKVKIVDYTCKTTSSIGYFLSKTKMCWRQHNMAAIMDFFIPTCKYQYHLPIYQVW